MVSGRGGGGGGGGSLVVVCSRLLDDLTLLRAAYEILSDDKKRTVYDRFGEEGLKQQGASGHGGGDFHDPFDIFAQYVLHGGAGGVL